MRSVMEIASVPEEEWTDEERERFNSFESRLDDLLARSEKLLKEKTENKD